MVVRKFAHTGYIKLCQARWQYADGRETVVRVAPKPPRRKAIGSLKIEYSPGSEYTRDLGKRTSAILNVFDHVNKRHQVKDTRGKWQLLSRTHSEVCLDPVALGSDTRTAHQGFIYVEP